AAAVTGAVRRTRPPQPPWPEDPTAANNGQEPRRDPGRPALRLHASEEAEQKLVDPFRLVELQPVARAVDAFVAPVAGDMLARAQQRLLEQVVVAARPDPERRRCDRRKRQPLPELPLRVQVRAVPVQRGSQRTGTRELREVPLDVAFAAHPLARELPVVALEQLLRNAFELEEQHVPRLLPLLHRLLSVRARVADRHYDEALHPLR